MRIVVVLCAALALSACGTSSPVYRGAAPPPVSTNPAPVQAHALARSVTYTCEDLTTVVMTEGQPDVRATLNSGLQLSLARLGGFGTRYGAPPYEFRPAGSEGMWLNQGRASRCRVK